ncbi:hypothetical protein F5146DRAFT_1006715 [Armillaria mellea]|nr:hypothetical protein F5146DRAFT_1006715 [Armillaria mellea]
MFPCCIKEPPLLLGLYLVFLLILLMDDSYDAWNNTSSQYDWSHGISKEQWGNMNWGLLHHALTWTEEHHDADGKIALIATKQGCKLWVTLFPMQDLHHNKVFQFYDDALNINGHNESRHRQDLSLGFTLVLLPGDCYFQPSGAIHAVYMPEPSFTQGASFWSLATMHQVEASHSYDIEGGIWSTNLDHKPEHVYEGIIHMMLYLPTNPDKLHYKWSLAFFLFLVLDPVSYIPMHRRTYEFPIGEDESAERTTHGLYQKAL